MRTRVGGVLLLLALAACGRAGGLVEIPPEDLPFVVARGTPTIEPTAPPRAFTVYFARDGRLFRVRRQIEANAPSAEAAVRALLSGPTSSERRMRIDSELPPAVRLLGLSPEAETTLVDLSGEFQEPAPPEKIALRVAQVVWTLTEFPSIQAIRFSIDGEEVAVTAGDGTTIERPVTREDYASVSPF